MILLIHKELIMNNDLFITFDKNSYNSKTIKEEEHSRARHPSLEDEINYLNELKQLIEIKVKEINQESIYSIT